MGKVFDLTDEEVWLGISSSSPRVCVALIDPLNPSFFWEKSALANHNASSAISILVGEAREVCHLADKRIGAVLVDIGPGSHTGTRVGVSFAKAYALGSNLGMVAVEAFDLISTEEVVSISSRKGEFVVREVGQSPRVCTELPTGSVGWSKDEIEPKYPSFRGYSEWFTNVKNGSAVEIVPAYYGEPLVSTPKVQFAMKNSEKVMR